MLSNFDAFVITSNPSLKDESIYHAEELKTEIRKTNGMKVIRVNNNNNKNKNNRHNDDNDNSNGNSNANDDGDDDDDNDDDDDDDLKIR